MELRYHTSECCTQHNDTTYSKTEFPFLMYSMSWELGSTRTGCLKTTTSKSLLWLMLMLLEFLRIKSLVTVSEVLSTDGTYVTDCMYCTCVNVLVGLVGVSVSHMT